MRASQLITRSLTFYWRSNLGVVFGTAVATAILTGALIVGDSVRFTLRSIVDARLGLTEYVLEGHDRSFRHELAHDLNLSQSAAAVLITNGVAISNDRQLRLNNVQVVGVDQRFWPIGGTTDPFAGKTGDIAIVNTHLAARLALIVDDELLLRLQRSTSIPGSFALGAAAESAALSLQVIKIADDQHFGRFGLASNQVSPLTIFVPIDTLASAIDLEGRANTILVARSEGRSPEPDDLEQKLNDAWTLDDAGLTIRQYADGLELVSDSVFINPSVVEAIKEQENQYPVLTYLVNSIRAGDHSTPYSFVSAPGPELIPPEMRDDEIILNAWLGKDLQIGPGDNVELSYFVPTSENGLLEKKASFTVRSIIPVNDAHQSLMPMIPGLSDADDCRDWHAGIPIDFDRVRDKDEAYWDDHRGTPKAFVTTATARLMWSNRFGETTALRFPGDRVNAPELEAKLLESLTARTQGIGWRALREQGIEASAHGVDFGQLFISLSFFIIAAAMMLTGMLHALNIAGRASELGTLLAVGYPKPLLRRIVLGEGAVLAIIGASIGVFGGIVYNKFVLMLLASVWQGAVGATAFEVHLKWQTITIGWIIGVVLSLVVIVLTTRRLMRQTAQSLLTGVPGQSLKAKGHRGRLSLGLSAFCIVPVVAILVFVGPGRGKEALGAFWGAGFLMLTAGLSLSHALLDRITLRTMNGRPTTTWLGIKNAARKIRQSVATIALLAFGVFIIVAVGANRHPPPRGLDDRSSGTGGFPLYAETTMPVHDNLSDASELHRLGLSEFGDDVSFVQMRLHQGSDASCLNLNRVGNPPILGIDPEELRRRGAFSFASTTDGTDPEDIWSLLDIELPDGVIPAVADQTVIVWGLGMSIGDEISLIDEHGNDLRLRLVGGLANSVFQGHLLISEQHFLDSFPSSRGSQVFLVDAPIEKADEVAVLLRTGLRDHGVEVQYAADRLAAFSVVENTYLTIFLMLGGFGVMLGTLGLGIIILRNVMAQRSELALLRAVGLSRNHVTRILLSEYLGLLTGGVVCGTLAALVAILPALMAPGASIPYAALLAMIAAIFGCGWLSVWLATRVATAGEPLAALRRE